jgi:hypothetical protein
MSPKQPRWSIDVVRTRASARPRTARGRLRHTVETGASRIIPSESRHGSDIARRAWHDSYVPVVFLITIVAVLVGIFFAATGRGGEMAYEQADQAPLDLGPVSAADVALLRPPTALWGYNMQVTDAALDQVARAMRERDITIAYLQERVASFERDGSFTEYAEPRGVQARQGAGLAPVLGVPGLPEAPAGAETFETPQPYHAPDDTLDDLHPAEMSEDAETFDAPESVGFLDDFLRMETPEAAEPEAFQPAETEPESQPAESPAAETQETAAETQETAETQEAQEPPRTPLILKASPPPESHEATQPSETLQDPGSHETTQPSEIYDPAQPTDEAHGPQGDFNAHDWWAEQREAARQEDAGSPAGTAETAERGETAETGEGQEFGPAEEQSW